jgi:hypothetical protein
MVLAGERVFEVLSVTPKVVWLEIAHS